MESSIRTLIVNGLSFLSALFVFLAIFVPGVISIRRMVKERSLEASDTAIKFTFLFFFLAIISSSFLLAVKDPKNILGAILSGVGLTIALLFFGVITLLQIRRVRGKGAIKRFFTKAR